MNYEISYRARICTEVLEELFKPEMGRLERKLSKLLVEAAGSAVTNTAIHYKGRSHFVDGSTAYHGAHVRELPANQIPAMEAYLAEVKQVELDKNMVRQVLAALLFNCEGAQDVRDALPDCAMPALIASELQRTRPEAWSVQNTPSLLRQYMKYRDLLYQYAATRLLY